MTINVRVINSLSSASMADSLISHREAYVQRIYLLRHSAGQCRSSFWQYFLGNFGSVSGVPTLSVAKMTTNIVDRHHCGNRRPLTANISQTYGMACRPTMSTPQIDRLTCQRTKKSHQTSFSDIVGRILAPMPNGHHCLSADSVTSKWRPKLSADIQWLTMMGCMARPLGIA